MKKRFLLASAAALPRYKGGVRRSVAAPRSCTPPLEPPCRKEACSHAWTALGPAFLLARYSETFRRLETVRKCWCKELTARSQSPAQHAWRS